MSCGRYAPSPTGRLHLGNLRTALLAWLQCRLINGKFILRIDDLDQPRNVPGSLEQIIEDLYWLGLDWDEGPDVGGINGPYLQSLRLGFYRRAFDSLRKYGCVFPCVCSRKDIAMALSAPHQDQPVNIYPGTCRPTASILVGARAVDARENFAWRFAVGDQTVHFDDEICGPQWLELKSCVGDFVVRRRDGLYAYQLVSVVDDQMMGVTDVLRGEDLINSTHRQLALIHALHYRIPGFWHVPLLRDNENRKMSKRDGSDSLKQWQERAGTAEQLVGYFAYSSGLIDENRPISATELLQTLDIRRYKAKLHGQKRKSSRMSC